MSIQQSVKRFAIVSYAEIQVFFGAHYLKGSDGSQPGCCDGLEGRNITLKENTTMKDLAVHAGMNGIRACRGRYETVGGRGIKSKEDLKKLEEYQKALAAGSQSPAQFPAIENGLFPRRDLTNGGVYIGEDCRAKRHFDCESFMAWAISYGLNDKWQNWKFGVHIYNKGLNKKLEVTPQGAGFPDKSQLLNGDILIRMTDNGEHMALVTENGGKVLQALDAAHGVIASPYHASH